MTWSFEPGIVIPLVLMALIYWRGARESLERSTRSRPAVVREVRFFVSGFAVLTLALVSPIHELGESLFSAHMVQHELLMAVAAPLLVLGNPVVPVLWGLPEKARAPFARVFSVHLPPLAAFLLHAAAIWIWHAPPLYDASVTNQAVHALQHLSFFLTAILFWWSLFNSRRQKGSEGAAVIYLFLTAVHTTLLGALLTVSESPLYSVYHDATTRLWGLSALEDQQLGGIIMWVPGGIVYLGAALWLMYKWLVESAARANEGDARRRAAFAANAARGAALVAVMLIANGCNDHRDAEWAAEMTGGTPVRGQEAIRSYGCMSCHTIPGIAGANKLVGPPLAGIASRVYIAGVMSNTPDHMIEWLMNPPKIDSKTAMPNMHVTERDARDIAAYLYTLK